jgi:hypothetical protein
MIMGKGLRRIVMGLLLLPASNLAMADVIHWEVTSYDVPDYFDNNFAVSGGFDFDTVTKAVSNITVKSTDGPSCFTCNDYAGGTGVYFLEELFGFANISLREVFATGGVVDRSFSLTFFETTTNSTVPTFYWNAPGTYTNLGFETTGYLRLDDPFDPDIVEDIDCSYCITAVGTVISAPVPEPETYLMMLVGLLGLGWTVRSRRRQ